MTGPLHGIRVIDLSTILVGPYGTQLLGDMGADIIKVEEPPEGDATRTLGESRHPGMSGLFLNSNRNKRSIALDLKKEAAKEALRRLIETADVFVHNMRPKAIARLGFTYEEVTAVKSDIVYCGAYGYSIKGPYSNNPAYDDMIQGSSGLAALFARTSGEARFVPTVMADKITGMMISQSVAMALLHRERTGEGQAIEVPMFELMVSFLMVEHLFGRAFEPPLGPVGYPRLVTGTRKPHKTKDGYICVLPYSDRHWQLFFDIVGREDLKSDERFHSHGARLKHIDTLYEFMEAEIAKRDSAEWLKKLGEAQIPAMPVLDVEDLFDDPQIKAFGLFERHEHPSEGATLLAGVPVTMSKTPGAIWRPAPRLGEHGRDLLAEVGFSTEEIETLIAEGALVAE